MSHRFTSPCSCSPRSRSWPRRLSSADQPAAKKDQPPDPKLEHKNFVEKAASFKTIADATTKKTTRIDMKNQFEMVFVPGRRGDDRQPGVGSRAGCRTRDRSYKAKVGNFWMQKFEVTWNDWDLFWYDENYLKADNKAAEEARARRGHPADQHLPRRDLRPRPRRPPRHLHDPPRGDDVLRLAAQEDRQGLPPARPRPSGNTPPEPARATRPTSSATIPKSLGDYAWYKENSVDPDFPDLPKGCTHKVGTRKANPFGIHDLYGNVWEWTLDQYDPKTYRSGR